MSQFYEMVQVPNYGLGVAKRQFQNITSIHKFGAVPAMSQNQTGTIWDVDDTNYPWSTWDTAGTVSIPAVNASDDGKSVVLVGLDSDYAEQQETVTVSSSGATTSTSSFKRIFRAYVTDEANVSDITIQKDSTTVARIKAGKAQTLMAVYTIPAGKIGYLTKGVCTVQAGADATADMFIRYFGQQAFRVGHSFEISGSGGKYEYEFTVPVRISAKSDIDIRANVRSNNARITAAFDIILDEDN